MTQSPPPQRKKILFVVTAMALAVGISAVMHFFILPGTLTVVPLNNPIVESVSIPYEMTMSPNSDDHAVGARLGESKLLRIYVRKDLEPTEHYIKSATGHDFATPDNDTLITVTINGRRWRFDFAAGDDEDANIAYLRQGPWCILIVGSSMDRPAIQRLAEAVVFRGDQ